MRLLFYCAILGCAGAALHQRWRMRVPWEGTSHGNLVLILAVIAITTLLADLMLNTRPVPGEEHTGLLEWGLRLLGLALAGGALYAAHH